MRLRALLVAIVALVACQQTDRPLVVLMDSRHPARIYDSSTVAANRTNADVLDEIIADLPVRTRKETIGPAWNSDADIRRAAPALIVIHYSGFCEESCADRARLRTLVDTMATSPVRFLVYSRMFEDSLRAGVDSLLRDVERAHPGTLRRVDVFGLNNHGTPRWRDTATASALHRRVKAVLGLP
jgi:hypothetical protein